MNRIVDVCKSIRSRSMLGDRERWAAIVSALLLFVIPANASASDACKACAVIPYTLTVDKFVPEHAVENRPFRVYFELLNRKSTPINGRVSFNGRTDPDLGSPSFDVKNLAPGAIARGSVVGLAGEPAAHALVTLDYFDADAAAAAAAQGRESFGPHTQAFGSIDIAGRYEFRVDYMVVVETRSKVRDTVFAEVTATFGPDALPNPRPQYASDAGKPVLTQAVSLGDLGDDSKVQLPFAFGPFEAVPGDARNLDFNYVVLNSGYAASGQATGKKVLDILSTLGAGVATAAVGYGSAWEAADGLHHMFNAAMFSDCDGLVAAHVASLSSVQLAQLTLSGPNRNSYSETRAFPGTVSADGCGPNSLYRVRFTIVRLSAFGL